MMIFLEMLGKSIAVLVFILLNAMFLVWWERKVLGHMQVRLGPMRVGWHGVLQTIADALKLLFKEDIIPSKADRFLFIIAPLMTFLPSFMVFVAIPFSDKLQVHDLDVGIFYVLAVAAMGHVGIIIAGWASHNKWSLFGGMRSAAQQISYEVPMLLSVLGVVMLSRTMSLQGIVAAQKHVWFIAGPQVIGFFIFIVTMLAEINRTPFDMPEAESELVAGYNVEYTSSKFLVFFLAEYTNTFTVAALAVTLFLGGWNGPVLPPLAWFMIKTYSVIWFIFWVRATLPRVRVDQLMILSWKFLIPLGLANIGLQGFYILTIR